MKTVSGAVVDLFECQQMINKTLIKPQKFQLSNNSCFSTAEMNFSYNIRSKKNNMFHFFSRLVTKTLDE